MSERHASLHAVRSVLQQYCTLRDLARLVCVDRRLRRTFQAAHVSRIDAASWCITVCYQIAPEDHTFALCYAVAEFYSPGVLALRSKVKPSLEPQPPPPPSPEARVPTRPALGGSAAFAVMLARSETVLEALSTAFSENSTRIVCLRGLGGAMAHFILTSWSQASLFVHAHLNESGNAVVVDRLSARLSDAHDPESMVAHSSSAACESSKELSSSVDADRTRSDTLHSKGVPRHMDVASASHAPDIWRVYDANTCTDASFPIVTQAISGSFIVLYAALAAQQALRWTRVTTEETSDVSASSRRRGIGRLNRSNYVTLTLKLGVREAHHDVSTEAIWAESHEHGMRESAEDDSTRSSMNESAALSQRSSFSIPVFCVFASHSAPHRKVNGGGARTRADEAPVFSESKTQACILRRTPGSLGPEDEESSGVVRSPRQDLLYGDCRERAELRSMVQRARENATQRGWIEVARDLYARCAGFLATLDAQADVAHSSVRSPIAPSLVIPRVSIVEAVHFGTKGARGRPGLQGLRGLDAFCVCQESQPADLPERVVRSSPEPDPAMLNFGERGSQGYDGRAGPSGRPCRSEF